jgi:penicillin-binding protein 1A
MSSAEQEFRRGEQDNQHNPKPPSELRREAFGQIAQGLRQLFAAMTAGCAGMSRHAAPFGRACFMLCKIAVVASVLIFLGLATAMLWVLYDVPLQTPGRDGPSVLVEAADGQPLGRVGQLGDAVERKDFPDHLVHAVTSIEDRRFFSHRGVDLRGILRAAYANWSAGGIVEGGSTITQQLAKMQVVGAERSLSRKFREAFIATWMELRLEKDEILTRYLNAVYLGAGGHGMSAAARMYFDKNVSELTLPEAAMLAGLIQAPSKYNPTRDLNAAQARAAMVIDAMLEAGAIDEAAAAKAKAEPATLKLSPRTARAGSWFADWIAKHEVPKIAGSLGRALRVRTTLQPEVQQLAERIVNEALSDPEEARGAGQAALVAMRPDGAVVAMVGGRAYEESQFNRAVDAQRQPGSAFKLFVYYAALRNGYTLESRIDASPIEVGGWKPDNYGGQQFGRMPLSQAFAQSVNSAAVRLGGTVGLDEVVLAARDLGLDAPLTKVPSMALGTNEVNLLDLTGAFASVRAARPRLEPWGIAAFGPEGAGLRTLGPPTTASDALPKHEDLTRLLREVVARGTGRAAALDDGEAAGKTGTSQDYRDAWFVGFNHALVVGVWAGNDDRTPMQGVTGGSLPAVIWKRFVSAATPLVDRPSEAVATHSAAPATAEPAPVVLPTVASQPQCDHSACAAEYSSFRASDCTYQPLGGGPRRLCEKGGPATGSSQSLARAPTTAGQGLCNRERCARRYSSFDASTCTYQPFDGGPRQLCDIQE